MEFHHVKEVVWCHSAGVPTSTSKGPQAAAVVADLSETTFNTPDGDIV